MTVYLEKKIKNFCAHKIIFSTQITPSYALRTSLFFRASRLIETIDDYLRGLRTTEEYLRGLRFIIYDYLRGLSLLDLFRIFYGCTPAAPKLSRVREIFSQFFERAPQAFPLGYGPGAAGKIFKKTGLGCLVP